MPWQPVPGGAPEPVDAADWFTAEEVARAEAYSRVARAWSWSSLAVSLLVAVALGTTRWGERLVGRLWGGWAVRTLAAVAVVLLLGRVVTLPLAAGLHAHRRGAGLSTQAWPGFLRDVAVGTALDVVVTGLALVAVVGLARRLPRAWPAAAGALLGAAVLAGSFTYPLVVEPLFNRVEPLPAGPLRTEVLALAASERVDVDEVLVADASRRTTSLNAYVSGFGSSRRVVLYDTAVADLPREQLLAVVAHELAHARHDDVLVGTVIGAGGAVAAGGLLALLVPAGGRRARRGRRVAGAARPEAVPRVLALVAVTTLLLAPVQNGASRLVETRADLDARTATQDPEALAGLQVSLARRSLADPTPPAWSHFWFSSHPTVLERIALATSLGGQRDR
nr:M48 family metalloprotease [Nocardioides perillae]